MLSKWFVLVLFVTTPCFLHGQKLVSGKVTDSLGEALPQANVIVKSRHKTLKYILTDSLGFFEVEVPILPEYDVKVTYFGYQSEVKHIVSHSLLTGLKFVLYPDRTALKEVVINANIPDFVQKKDTIVYNLKALTDGSELKLKDLVQKLPGFQIDENGKITHNGKPIDKILINDKEFFNRQQQIATKNIDADMISGIAFYQKYKSEFEAKTDAGVRALNVNIKAKYMDKLKGNILGGISTDYRYKGHLNLFKFAKNANLSIITDVNTWGQNALTLNDYIDFTGGVNAYIKGNAHSGIVDIDEESIPTFLLKGDDVEKRHTKFSGVNVVLQKKHRYRFMGFYLLNYMRQAGFDKQIRRFIDGQTNFSTNSLDGNYFVVNMYNKLLCRLSSKDLISVLLNGTWQNNQGIYFNISNQSQLHNRFKRLNKNIGVNIKFNRTLNDFLIFDLKLLYNYQFRHKLYSIRANYPFLNYLNLNNFDNIYTYNRLKTNYGITGKLSFFKAHYSIDFVMGSQFNHNFLNSDLANSILQNQMKRNEFDGFTGAKIKYDQLDWHFILSGFWHYIHIQQANRKTAFHYFAPFMSLTYMFNLGHSLDFSYNYTYKLLPINKFNLHYIFDDFESLSETELRYDDLWLPRHQISLTYQNYLKKQRFYYDLNINFDFAKKSIQNKLEHFESQLYYYKKVLIPSSHSVMLNLDLNKSLTKHFFISLTNDFIFSKQKIFYNNNLQHFNSQVYKNDFSIYSKYKKSWINGSLGLKNKKYYYVYKTLNVKHQYTSTTYYTKLEGKLKKSFKWSVYAGYEHFNFLQNEYILKINPSFFYQSDKSFQLSLIGNNILNINQPVYTKHSQTDDFEIFEQTAYLPGYIALQLKYNF